MASPKRTGANADWIDEWLDAVRAGNATMSQRAVSAIEAHGGLQVAIEKARSKGVHLVQLTDEKGKLLIAASREPFETLC